MSDNDVVKALEYCSKGEFMNCQGCSAKDCTHNTDKKIKRYAEVF